ncbi:MAG: hypothetical protein VW907_09690 [Opitutae bacterium]
MVIAPIAAAAAPIVVQSATDENGLINQAFKLVVIISLALTVSIGVYLTIKLVPGIIAIQQSAANLLNNVSSSIGFAGTIATAILSATPLGRGLAIFRKAF